MKFHFEIVSGIIRLLPTGTYGEPYKWHTLAIIDNGVMTLKGSLALPDGFSINAFRDLCNQLNVHTVKWQRLKDGEVKDITIKVNKSEQKT